MIIKSLTVKNFRNHAFLTYDFSPGLNIITGPNGVGKTNIVEAVYYLSLARSFRLNEDSGLIQKGKDMAEIESAISEGKITRKVNIKITPEGKKITINGKAISKLSDLARAVNVVMFEPKDVLLFRGFPKARRSFLDVSISKKSDPYLDYISRYDKILRERNEILKLPKLDQNLLDSTTEMLVKLAGPIVSYRAMYVKDINDILNKITRALTREENKIEVIYKPFVEYDDNFNTNATEAFKKAEESDFKHKATSIGIQREDFSVNFNGRDIGEYGSQGENRVVALALKLAPYFLIEDRDKRPVVVLDDVMSELDQFHRLQLLTFLRKFEQVFITATKLEVEGASHYQIKTKN